MIRVHALAQLQGLRGLHGQLGVVGHGEAAGVRLDHRPQQLHTQHGQPRAVSTALGAQLHIPPALLTPLRAAVAPLHVAAGLAVGAQELAARALGGVRELAGRA